MIRMRSSKTTSLLALLAFSFDSLPQAYGREFVRRIVVRHPLRMLRGLLAYRRILAADRPEERLLFPNTRDRGDELVKYIAADGERLLVATGFCQKPLRTAGSTHDCPAGRFNHQCLYLSHLELNSGSTVLLPPACADCAIRVLGHAALKAGASFAVLTSALDIANDILLPALEEQRFTRVVFAICPYSIEPMSLALLICGVEGYVFHYAAGSCMDYSQWLRADAGDKPERTVLSSQTMARMLRLLHAVAACHRSNKTTQPVRYQQVGHVFRCVKDAVSREPKAPVGGAAPRG